jgi:thioesterase domain-containing protein
MKHKNQQILDNAIQLTHVMGIIDDRYNSRELTIVAPLANNFNHLGTAFGGSLYIACVLSAWGLLYLRLRKAGVEGNIVIRKGEVEYLRPVTGDIVATGTLPPEEEVAAFIDAFKETGKAKMTIHAVIDVEGKVAVKFEGAFAVVR